MPRTELRMRIAHEAARLLAEHGGSDYGRARRKAAARLGIEDEQLLPSLAEIEAALMQHQRLFRNAEQRDWLRQRREVAREAMRFLAAFEPHLVGSVLEGSANRHSSVMLHLFSDDPNAVLERLERHGIRAEAGAGRLEYATRRLENVPTLRFIAEHVPIELLLLPYDALREAPFDPIHEAPLRRANLAAVERLLAAEGEQTQ
jgi:hypothetical protein